MDIKKTVVIGIIIGIIVFIICYLFVQPFMDFMVPKFLFLSSKCGSFFSNQIYKNAALMDRANFDSAIFSLVSGMLLAFPISLLLISFINKNKRYDKIKKLIKPSIWKDRFFAIILLIAIGFVSLLLYTDHYLNLRFSRKMIILKPYLSEQQEDELLSKWALMESRDDYRAINDVLHGYAEKNNVKKPKSVWE